jgi:hypothetical protein
MPRPPYSFKPTKPSYPNGLSLPPPPCQSWRPACVACTPPRPTTTTTWPSSSLCPFRRRRPSPISSRSKARRSNLSRLAQARQPHAYMVGGQSPTKRPLARSRHDGGGAGRDSSRQDGGRAIHNHDSDELPSSTYRQT